MKRHFLPAACALLIAGIASAQGQSRPAPPEPPITVAPRPPDEPEPKPDPELDKKMDALIGQLGSEDWDERAEAERQLEEIGKPASDKLRKAMETATDPEVKVRAKRILQKFGATQPTSDLDDSQFEEFCEMLRSQDGVSWYSPKSEKPYFYMYQLYQRPEFADAMKNKKFAPRLAKALGDASANCKRNAAYLLGEIGNAEVAKDVAVLLKDSEPLTRAVAVYVLGRLGATANLQEIFAAMRDEDRIVRAAAAAALEHVPDASSVEPLLVALRDSDPYVRYHALYSLRALSGQPLKFNAWKDEKTRDAALQGIEEWWTKAKADFKPAPPRKVEKQDDGSTEDEPHFVVPVK